MTANLTMTDLFCGAGGSSTGAVNVPGVTVRLAANHWDLAIETHNANHPDTDHLQADISQTDPHYVPATDLLWASPECTNHSRAKGRKAHRQPDLFGDVLPDEAAERSRATMWDVVRFTEAHEYRAILVENVVEVVDWSSAHGVRGGLFESWLAAMHSMGYRHRIISLNSMHAQAMGPPAPQSRDRVYIAFWREGERAPDFERMQRPRAYCPRCGDLVDAMQAWKRPGSRTGRYRTQYVYRCPKASCRGQQVEPGWLPASSIIDWSLPGTRIGDRARPLAEKTMRRIQMGIDRYWAPLLVENGGNPYDAADPLMVPVEGRDGKEARIAAEALRTMTTRNETGVALPPFPPFFAELRGGGSTVRAASEALATITASGNHHALISSYYGNGDAMNEGGAEMTTPAGEPVRTLTTTSHQALRRTEQPTVNVDDVYFRMLEPHEIKQAMAFPADYVMRGNRREQVKLSGNAVTPPAARDLIATVVEAVTGEAVA